ncbi:MAG: FFLEELY motif protein [Steroidobacterales bacterium]
MKGAQRLDALLARKRALDSPACRTAGFTASLTRLRIWQAARLARTYQDFHDDPRYAPALAFFLSDLYGPQEFPERNRDLRRALTYLKRALPAALLKVLAQAIELDVLTLELDHAMVRALGASPVSDATYAAAYRSAADTASRIRQIDLIVGIGEDLARVVRKAWIGPLLQAAHVPAHAAGFGALQDFLERGHAAFRQMQGGGRLLQAIRERETQFMHMMLGGEAVHD